MKTHILLSVLIAASITTAANKTVLLKLNYAAKQNWTYALDYKSECLFSGVGPETSKKTAITCDITGELSTEKDKILTRTANFNIESDLYDSSVISSLTEKTSSVNYALNLIDGSPVVENNIDLSDGAPEWNIYMQLARLIPDMPQQPVKKGYTWDRNASLPLQSPYGKIQCEIYRLFKVEKISSKGDSVEISWQFKYSSSEKFDSTRITKYVPVAGSGSGNAIIDVTNGFIIKASMEFQTPVAKINKARINWTEKAILTYKEK